MDALVNKLSNNGLKAECRIIELWKYVVREENPNADIIDHIYTLNNSQNTIRLLLGKPAIKSPITNDTFQGDDYCNNIVTIGIASGF